MSSDDEDDVAPLRGAVGWWFCTDDYNVVGKVFTLTVAPSDDDDDGADWFCDEYCTVLVVVFAPVWE